MNKLNGWGWRGVTLLIMITRIRVTDMRLSTYV
jgi:hypothetical protein